MAVLKSAVQKLHNQALARASKRSRRQLGKKANKKMTSLVTSRLCRADAETRVLTDSLYTLEGYLLKLIGGDRHTLEAIRKEVL